MIPHAEKQLSRCTTTPEPTPQSLCSATREAITINEPTCLNYRVVPTCCNKRKPINRNKDPTEPINKYIKTEKRCLKKKIQNYCQESFIHATPLESYPHRQDLESKQQQIDIQWYLTMDLVCISLIASDVKHLFMCLVAMISIYLFWWNDSSYLFLIF